MRKPRFKWDGESLCAMVPLTAAEIGAVDAFANATRERGREPLMDSLHLCALAEDRVRGRHTEKRTVTCNAIGPSLGRYYCAGCSKPWPCPTLQDIIGEEGQ